ncbi:glycosyltransferase family 2 protein [Phytomonospora sp. NPDC050363]|uniref:glycosyltransferase family 2 protein n=1 Tax=Phytomonospora sp. NPDC050363 TaxID=3155642 RepID=UPI0033D4CFD6
MPALMPVPAVSVIIPVYNVRPWLGECFESLRRQTIGMENIEIIAVDDRSTDGGWEELQRLAEDFPQLTVDRLAANSGGPGAPRNRGLDKATGTFVFFLDPDDYLGDEALERMVATAERVPSDVVVGKIVTPEGQVDRAPKSMFARTVDKVDLYDSKVFNSLGPWKLFRRSLIEDHAIRFPEGVPRREDGPFTSRCFLKARAISIIADYDCYYLRTRPDGSNATSQRPDYPALLTIADDLIDAVFEHLPPGPERDYLIRRHVRIAIMSAFKGWWLANLSPEEQRQTFDQAHAMLDRCLTDGVLAGLEPVWRLRSSLVARNEFDAFMKALPVTFQAEPSAVVEDGRVYIPFSYFRDPELAIPDSVYEVTDRLRVQHSLDGLTWGHDGLHVRGAASIAHLADREASVRLLLRERTTKAAVAVPATAAATATGEPATFEAHIDLATADGGAPLPAGMWDISVEATAEGVTREARLGSRRDEAIGTDPASHAVAHHPGTEVVATTYFSRYGNLGIDVGERTHTSFPQPRLASLRSSTTGLRLDVDYPDASDAGLSAEIRLVRDSTTRSVPTEVTADGSGLRLSAALALPVLRLRPGVWDARVLITSGDLRREVVLKDGKGKPVRVNVLPKWGALRGRLGK